jgi:5-methylcytosine-specific restriction endonuclease McrA
MLMLPKLTKPVLILNKNWTAIGTAPVYKVLNLLLSGPPKAEVIDESCVPYTWEEWSKIKPPKDSEEAIHTVNYIFRIPEIIKLNKYDRYPRQLIIFSRANIFRRDDYRCQYCGIKPGSEELTIDHILPKSKGGKTTWTNCVLSCVECNSIKGDYLLDKVKNKKFPSGMKLFKDPRKPKIRDFKFHIHYKSWEQWLDAAYWNIELENENAR